jgi:uncharacterized protein (DUF58 family)
MLHTQDIITRIRDLEIRTRGLTRQVFSGEYHSAFKGRGMAFSEVREYQFGDEVRTIDWNVTARYNQPFVKVFEEERELTVMLLIDMSGSQWFGSTERTKRNLAIEIAAVLAFSAIENNDKVGAILIADKVERYIAPGKGRKHALMLLHQLLEWDGRSTQTNLFEGLRYLRNTQKKRCIAFVISDFTDEQFLESLRITRKRHDVVAIKVSDPAERELPNIGLVYLNHAETRSPAWVNTSHPATRENWKTYFEEREISFVEDMKRLGVDSISVETHEDFIQPLITLFKKRQ